MALNGDQHKQISNHELFGNAAAYHAAVSFTGHVEKNGVPENHSEAQNLVMGYAKDFVDGNIDEKSLKLDKDQAMKFATLSLEQGIRRPGKSITQLSERPSTRG